jgi:hypothetical protein
MASISSQEPLPSLQTGEAIDGFPETAALISTMDAATCMRVLEYLRKGTGGTVVQKRNRVRMAVGVYVTRTVIR